MDLYRIEHDDRIVDPVVVAALDSWVDAGSASTTAAELLAPDGVVVASFDPDLVFDYRARRPTLDIRDGRPTDLTWPELTLKCARVGTRDLLVLTGAEPDYRWRSFAESVVELARRFGVVEWISLGSIPAAVPHTRPVNVLGTESRPGLLRGGVTPGPDGLLRVPAAAISVLDHAVSHAGIPTVGYYAQIPHYVTGSYPAAAVELLRLAGLHLDHEFPSGELRDQARQLATRLDAATASDETTKSYVERLESMVDEARLPSGDDLIAEIERFLRDRGGDGIDGGPRS
jgi:hypothetical protein